MIGWRLVADLDREFDEITFAQEPRRVGLDHQVFGGHGRAAESGRHGVVRSWAIAQEFPFGQRLGHGEFCPHGAVVVRDEVRERRKAVSCRFLRAAIMGSRSGVGVSLGTWPSSPEPPRLPGGGLGNSCLGSSAANPSVIGAAAASVGRQGALRFHRHPNPNCAAPTTLFRETDNPTDYCTIRLGK